MAAAPAQFPVCEHSRLVMPRYFFNISNGHRFQDPSGEELRDDDAAWAEALRTVRDIESSLDLDGSCHWSLEVKRGATSIFQIDVFRCKNRRRSALEARVLIQIGAVGTRPIAPVLLAPEDQSASD
jgi:uncharacterized protein DUF6894